MTDYDCSISTENALDYMRRVYDNFCAINSAMTLVDWTGMSADDSEWTDSELSRGRKEPSSYAKAE